MSNITYLGLFLVFSYDLYIYPEIIDNAKIFREPKNIIKRTIAVYPGTAITPKNFAAITKVPEIKEKEIPINPNIWIICMGKSEKA